MGSIKSYFPYQFTDGQNQAIVDIKSDMSSGKQMQRLLQADVGMGKSAVMFYIAIGCSLQKIRSLILVPTTILAQQHTDVLQSMGVKNVQLLLSGNQDNGAMITISTHTALNNKQLLKVIKFLCIDEFSKFGVQQKAQAMQYNPHVLLVSAVPIPRTLAMTAFGDLDISTIKEYPIKRGTVVTRWVHPDKRNLMYDLVERELRKGKQAYIVYPRIESGDEDIESAEKGYEEVKRHFPKYKVGYLTGKQSQQTKETVLNDFRFGFFNILVSTIISEVGLDVVNATVMVVEGADRFGLSQLHQLRGRVCRSTDTAFCFLIAKTANETSIARLKVMEACNDGFEIAEQDLQLRGPGEMFSTRQSGLPDLKFASLLDDYDLLIQARDRANEIVDRLDEPEYVGVKQMLEIKYGDSLRLGEVV